MSRWSLVPPLPGEDPQSILTRLVTDLNLILAEQEQDSLQIRGESGYTAKMKGTLDMQGNILKGLPARPQTDDEATSLQYTKSGNLLYSDSDVFITNRRIRHSGAQNDNESMTLEQVRRLIANKDLTAVPFITMLASTLLTSERVLTGSSTITVTDAGANTTATLDIPTTFITSGTFTPTLTIISNLTAVTAYACQYLRLGTIAAFSGQIDVTPTLTATLTRVDLSLPIASNIGSTEHLGGVAFAAGVAGQGAALYGNAGDNRARMQWISTDITNKGMYFICLYRII